MPVYNIYSLGKVYAMYSVGLSPREKYRAHQGILKIMDYYRCSTVHTANTYTMTWLQHCGMNSFFLHIFFVFASTMSDQHIQERCITVHVTLHAGLSCVRGGFTRTHIIVYRWEYLYYNYLFRCEICLTGSNLIQCAGKVHTVCTCAHTHTLLRYF